MPGLAQVQAFCARSDFLSGHWVFVAASTKRLILGDPSILADGFPVWDAPFVWNAILQSLQAEGSGIAGDGISSGLCPTRIHHHALLLKGPLQHCTQPCTLAHIFVATTRYYVLLLHFMELVSEEVRFASSPMICIKICL